MKCAGSPAALRAALRAAEGLRQKCKILFGTQLPPTTVEEREHGCARTCRVVVDAVSVSRAVHERVAARR